MEAMGQIPLFGWIVILVLIVLLFILAWFRGISFKKDEISIEKKLSEYDDKKFHDENLRLEINQQISEIDTKEHTEEKRLIKNFRIQVRLIIKGNTNCDIAFRSVVDILTEIISTRIMENNLRLHLSKEERKHYLSEILNEMEDNYTDFINDLRESICIKNNLTVNLYPDFKDIKEDFLNVLNEWANDTTKIIIKSCKDKIQIYNENSDSFLNSKYKETSIIKPIEKNEKYIQLLGGIIVNS